MSARRAKSARQAGFTLLEMLVVVMILALTASVALPLLGRPSDGLRLQTATSELLGALRATRAAAILRNSETVLTLDVDHRTFASPVIPLRAFAADITAKLTFASAERSAGSDGGFRFFPDGSSTGGDVTLSLRGHEAKICVDWLTGEARRERC
jgi:general secretion pathway protein H